MLARNITARTVVLVLVAGFGLVILFLLGASFMGVRGIRSIQQNAAKLVRQQAVTNGLIGELQRQQVNLSEVFSVLARDPDSVDYDRLMAQLAETESSMTRIAAEGALTPESDLWLHLKKASDEFTNEARRLLSVESPETFASIELFRYHEEFISFAAKLIERNYRVVLASQEEIDRRSERLLGESLLLAAACLVLAVVFAAVTLRMSGHLIRRMEWQAGELSRVSWHMLEDQESVARRFSHELHDELGQSLTAVKTNLTALEAAGADSERLHDCLRLVDESIGNVRQMSQLLRPTILDDFGLEAGIRWLVEGFTRRTGIEVDFHSNQPERLADETETHLFRISQEALTNVARHSGATRVAIDLERRGGEMLLTVRDNGCGLATPSGNGSRGMGMIGMRARARSLGGDVAVNSRPGEGVEIRVRIPVEHEAHSHSVS